MEAADEVVANTWHADTQQRVSHVGALAARSEHAPRYRPPSWAGGSLFLTSLASGRMTVFDLPRMRYAAGPLCPCSGVLRSSWLYCS